MKFSSLLHAVITADQRHSRTSADAVPGALDSLNAELSDRLTLRFERTAGDEIQALTDDPSAVVDAVIRLTQLGPWRIGIGLGGVDEPVPASTRAARGTAYIAAREAVESSRRAPGAVCLVSAAESVSGSRYGDVDALLSESAFVMLRAVLTRRSPEGWTVAALADAGYAGKDIAAELGITPSAVSQRLTRADYAEAQRGRDLATFLLAQAMGTQRIGD